MNNNMKVFLSAVASLFIVSSVTGCTDKQPSASGKEYITQEQIQSSGGYKFIVPNVGRFKIMNVVITENPNEKCSVDLNSIKNELVKQHQQNPDSIAKKKTIKVDLKLIKGAEKLHCSGGGTGCEATIEIDDEELDVKK